MKKDNGSLAEKVAIRRKALLVLGIAEPVVMETNGGAGVLWRECYSLFPKGVVFDKDARKTDILALQRPTSAVYEADSVVALLCGAGAHLVIDLLDVDTYGEPWLIIDAFLGSDRMLARRMVIVATDGLRQRINMGGASKCASLKEAAQVFGNSCYRDYLSVSRWMLDRAVEKAGFQVSQFAGYHSGHAQNMTHWVAEIVTRPGMAAGPA